LGREVLSYAEGVEAGILALERRLDADQHTLSGEIKITCPEVVGIRLLKSDLVARFQQRYPELRIEFMLSDKLLDLGSGEADIAIRATAPFDEELFGRKIAQTPWAIYASPEYLARHGGVSHVRDIEKHSVAVLDSDHEQNATKAWLSSVAPKAKIAARCNSMTALRAAAHSSAGLVSLPVTIGDSDRDLRRVFGPIEGLKTDFYLLIHREMKHSPKVRALFDFIVEEIALVRPVLSGQEL
jgi:DNA-binding transcriptional LysR family regulator